MKKFLHLGLLFAILATSMLTATACQAANEEPVVASTTAQNELNGTWTWTGTWTSVASGGNDKATLELRVDGNNAIGTVILANTRRGTVSIKVNGAVENNTISLKSESGSSTITLSVTATAVRGTMDAAGMGQIHLAFKKG